MIQPKDMYLFQGCVQYPDYFITHFEMRKIKFLSSKHYIDLNFLTTVPWSQNCLWLCINEVKPIFYGEEIDII